MGSEGGLFRSTVASAQVKRRKGYGVYVLYLYCAVDELEQKVGGARAKSWPRRLGACGAPVASIASIASVVSITITGRIRSDTARCFAGLPLFRSFRFS